MSPQTASGYVPPPDSTPWRNLTVCPSCREELTADGAGDVARCSCPARTTVIGFSSHIDYGVFTAPPNTQEDPNA